MKKYFSFFLIFTSCYTFANSNIETVLVQNLNFTYQNPHGQGTASKFTMSSSLLDENVQVEIYKIDKDFKLNVSGSEYNEFEFKNSPDFLTEAQTMTIKGFNLNLAQSLSLNLMSGSFSSTEGDQRASGLTMTCNRDKGHKDVLDQLLSGCIKKMVLKNSKFYSQSMDQGVVHTFNQVITEALIGNEKASSVVEVNSLEFKSSEGRFDLAADLRAQISGRIKSYGTLKYDALSGVLTIKISEIKFGFLNITSKVFDELEGQQTETFKVKEPYIYYSVK